ncbi:adenylosuccinate synthase [PVC group bacterium (ex Bugula neritina AB1)]|nr:adenylosuccinate synthase [PVC group bacterium (ex Bugula neritina AB1)]
MKNTVLIGAQWGDEGKGKIVDVLSESYDGVVRFQGGHNAGHTVVIEDQKFVLHLIPSGILRKDQECLIGNGVVIDPKCFLDEVDYLSEKGIEVAGRLWVSLQAHVIFPYHTSLDKSQESEKGSEKIGTTGRGIGPCYLDKYARQGIRVGDLLEKEFIEQKFKAILEKKNSDMKAQKQIGFDVQQVFDEYCAYAERLKPYAIDVSLRLHEMLSQKKKILFEGAQGSFLDIDFGTYPYVTSSSPVSGGACSGTGVGPCEIDEVLGIMKVYVTRVGEGPFPTEFDEETSLLIRQKGKEFGATTGRDRRCGWFDMVMAKYAVRVNGMTSLALTKLDVLDDMDVIKVCVGYSYKGEVLKNFPSQRHVLQGVEPVYDELPGWKSSTKNARSFEELPQKARQYLSYLGKSMGIPISLVSMGPERTQTLFI